MELCPSEMYAHNYIAGLLFLLATIVSIPPAAVELEKKLNVQMSGIVRFFVVFIIVMVAYAAMPTSTPTTVNNTTAIAAPPSAVSGSDTIAAAIPVLTENICN